MEFNVEEDGVLLQILEAMYPQSTKSKLRKMLTEGRVLVNEKPVYRAKELLVNGDRINIINRSDAMKKSPPPQPRKQSSKLKIIFEDSEVLVVEKPAGLLSIATDKLEKDTLHSRCVDHVKRQSERVWCHIVHRLDRDTSGVMVFAKDRETKENLQSQFAQRDVERIYHALVEGGPEHSEGTDSSWLIEDKHLHVKRVKSTFKGSKQSITHWRIEDQDEFVSLMEIKIETGRRHQIRMAMQFLGCPIVGDVIHGATTNPLNRICLHATSLGFVHPSTEKFVQYESNVPFANRLKIDFET
ncbi:MAG: RluA family pseudouridine synthase [Candidatus Thermoplasmatota archaeon]|nr:RluA family pseudouridine synthase [Candidatus Thermoplasmatota archaeon]